MRQSYPIAAHFQPETEWSNPLDPGELYRQRIIRVPQESRPDFDPAGNWSSSYRIWGNYGYVDRLSREIGFVHLKRERLGTQLCMITVHQEIYDLTGVSNRIRTRIQCRLNNRGLIVPVGWTLASEIISESGQIKRELSFEEEGRIDEDAMEIRTGSKKTRRAIQQPMTFSWGLIETVQRLDFDSVLSLRFSLLEEMLTVKDKQVLRYGGEYRFQSKWDPLHWYYQIGEGNLPFDFYVDAQHRAQLIVSMDRVYILDDQAQEKVLSANEKYRQQERKRD